MQLLEAPVVTRAGVVRGESAGAGGSEDVAGAGATLEEGGTLTTSGAGLLGGAGVVVESRDEAFLLLDHLLPIEPQRERERREKRGGRGKGRGMHKATRCRWCLVRVVCLLFRCRVVRRILPSNTSPRIAR